MEHLSGDLRQFPPMPRSLALALVVTLCTISCLGAPHPAPANLDFEKGSPGQVPPGWLAPTAKAGYKVELSTDSPKQGKQCVRLSGESSGPEAPGFGNVMQQIDASPYRGKRIRLRGAVRVEGRHGEIGRASCRERGE